MENLLGPRDANGIPVPLTVEESIASMKASLLKKSNARPTSIAWTAVAATAARLRSSLRCRHCLTPSASASRWCRPAPRGYPAVHRRGHPRDALACAARGSLRRIRKSASPTVPAATAAASSTIFTASGAAPTKSCRWTSSGLPADARRHAVRFCHGARPAGAEDPRPRAGELDNQPATILHPDMVQPLGEDRPHGTQAGGLPLRTPDCRRLSASAQPGDHQVARWLEAENDPRLNEIVANLNNIVDEARIR